MKVIYEVRECCDRETNYVNYFHSRDEAVRYYNYKTSGVIKFTETEQPKDRGYYNDWNSKVLRYCYDEKHGFNVTLNELRFTDGV